MHKLNKEQQKLCEDNINLARYHANKWATTQSYLDYDELESIAMLSLTKSAITYKEDKNTQFNTYYNRVVNNAFKNELKRAKKKPITIEEIENNSIIEDFDISNSLDFKTILSKLDTFQVKILNDFYTQGYTQQEIADRYNISQTSVSIILKKIRKEIYDYINKNA